MFKLFLAVFALLMGGCTTMTLNKAETKAFTEGSFLVRLKVTNNDDAEGKSVYDRTLNAMITDDEFQKDVRRFRMTHAVGRTSALGIIFKMHYYYIDDSVPTVSKGDIVDVLYPSLGENRPAFMNKEESEYLRDGHGATVVRLVCKAEDEACQDAEEDKHDGKLTGVIFTEPEKEGWPGDFSTVRVSPRK